MVRCTTKGAVVTLPNGGVLTGAKLRFHCNTCGYDNVVDQVVRYTGSVAVPDGAGWEYYECQTQGCCNTIYWGGEIKCQNEPSQGG